MPDGMNNIMNQYKVITDIASSGIIDPVVINRFLSSLLVLDAMLGDYHDPPYRQARATVLSDFETIDKITDKGRYLNSAYIGGIKWIKAISELMARKGWIAPIPIITTQDQVNPETAFSSQIIDDANAPDNSPGDEQ